MASQTIEQIAELAGVSRSTVSRVLNHHPSVRSEVRERVLRVINEQGYAPQAAARNLARRRTHTIGLVIPLGTAESFSDPFFGPLIQAATEASTRAGYFALLSIVTADSERDFYERILRSRPFDGIFLFTGNINDQLLPQLIADKIPLVLLGSHPYFQDLAWVSVESYASAQRAVGHLIGLGHRCIATITGPPSNPAAVERCEGYKQGMLDARLPLRSEYIAEGNWTQHSGYTAMHTLLSLPERPTAVFVANDTMAIGAMRAIHEAGYTVPSDIALMGFDDLAFAAYTNPPLSTVRVSVTDMGKTAVRLLIDQIEGGDAHRQVCIPTELIIRSSCGAEAHSLVA